MPEIRKDFLTGATVAISEEREMRPFFHKREDMDVSRENCPFCPENAFMTPGDVYVSKDGRVRAVPNKYPAFAENSCAYGFHEVVIDTPVHEEKLKDFSIDGLGTALSAIRARTDFYYRNHQIKYVQIIKNDGQNAGASIFHSHWQLFALDFLPALQKTIHTNLYYYEQRVRSCFLCDIKNGAGLLTVYENAYFLAYSPYASLYPHMVQIISKEHIGDIRDFDGARLEALAESLKIIAAALDAVVPNLSYNICFQNSPYHMESVQYRAAHFFIRFIPRIGNLAGFELSTGCYISSVAPEKSCASLKKAIAELRF